MPNQPLSQLDPEGLEAYFTDVEHLREMFKNLVAVPVLPKRLLIIHGVGGVGKSSLLRMFRLHCKRETVPVGLASGDDAKSAVEVLVRWSSDLKVDGLKLSTFIKTAEHYRAIQGKVEEQVHKARETRDSAARTLGKAAAKTVVETAVSTIPVVGPLISGLSGTGAEALVDWLGSFLNKPDIDLLLDPVKALTADFLADITTIAPQQRLVLILDTFEQMTALEEWTRDLAQQLHQNVLLVIAGRAVPNWSRKWPGWMSQAEVQELRPMTGAIMRELVSRYYATMRGGEPNSAQVEAILNFARGLPIVVTSAVQLWVQYGVEDFQTIKPQVMADLVDRLQEGVPKELTPVLEAAAAVRWFNNDILRAVTAQTDVSVAYDELRRFPFTRPRVEGLSLHTAMREIIDDNLRIRDPARHRALHERAATYFEAQLAQTGGLEAEQFELELLYHRVRANEALGMQLFQKIAEDLARYRLINRLSILLNDTNTYQLERENSRLWREYYNARLAYFQVHLAEAEQVYQRLSEYQGTELKLRTYVLCDWGELLSRYGLQRKDGIERANEILKQSLKCGIVDAHLSEIFFSLGRIARHQGQWDKENEYYEKARNFFEQKADNYILVGIYLQMKSSFGHRGLWQDFFLAHKRGVTSLSQIVPEPLKLKAIFLGSWTWSWALAGRATEAEQNAYESLAILDQLQDDPITLSVSRDLGWILGAQGRFNEAYKYFYKSLVLTQKLGESHLGHQAVTKMFWGVCLARAGQLDTAQEYLGQISADGEWSTKPGMLQSISWRGLVSELQGKLDEALYYYQKYLLDWKKYSLYYFECSVLTGIGRIKYSQKQYSEMPDLLKRAETLAQQYEYNDHLASLRLTQAHIAWDGNLPEWGSGFEAVLHYYQHALIYALRFNRFLLDEVLWGGGVCTPLRPIIPNCQEHGDEGRRMLTALHDWWLTGINDIGVARPDTISPIPEGMSLIEAECLARQREPGDGSKQQTVLAKIAAATA